MLSELSQSPSWESECPWVASHTCTPWRTWLLSLTVAGSDPWRHALPPVVSPTLKAGRPWRLILAPCSPPVQLQQRPRAQCWPCAGCSCYLHPVGHYSREESKAQRARTQSRSHQVDKALGEGGCRLWGPRAAVPHTSGGRWVRSVLPAWHPAPSSVVKSRSQEPGGKAGPAMVRDGHPELGLMVQRPPPPRYTDQCPRRAQPCPADPCSSSGHGGQVLGERGEGAMLGWAGPELVGAGYLGELGPGHHTGTAAACASWTGGLDGILQVKAGAGRAMAASVAPGCGQQSDDLGSPAGRRAAQRAPCEELQARPCFLLTALCPVPGRPAGAAPVGGTGSRQGGWAAATCGEKGGWSGGCWARWGGLL